MKQKLKMVGRKLVEALYSEFLTVDSGLVKATNGITTVSVPGKNAYSAIRGNWKDYRG